MAVPFSTFIRRFFCVVKNLAQRTTVLLFNQPFSTMSNTKDQNPVSDDEMDEEVDLNPFGYEDAEKQAWKKKYTYKYGKESINELPGGYVEFLVDLPVEFIENKLMQKWGISPGSKLIIR